MGIFIFIPSVEIMGIMLMRKYLHQYFRILSLRGACDEAISILQGIFQRLLRFTRNDTAFSSYFAKVLSHDKESLDICMQGIFPTEKKDPCLSASFHKYNDI